MEGKLVENGILVIGSASIDYNVLTPRLPRPGETLIGTRFFQVPGGKGANQAVAAARLGGHVEMLCRVGMDQNGKTIGDNLTQNGVRTDLVTVDSEVESGTAHIFISETAENLIAVVPGANGRVSPADVDRAFSARTRPLLLMLQLEIPLPTVAYAVAEATRLGIPIMLDPAPAAPLSDEIYRSVTYMTPNETEAESLTGVRVSDQASAIAAGEVLRRRGVLTPVMKLGAAGSVVWTGIEWIFVPPFKVNSVDSVAAGDAFAAGLAVALVEGRPLLEAVRWGSAAGALATTVYGAMSSLPRRAELEKLLST